MNEEAKLQEQKDKADQAKTLQQDSKPVEKPEEKVEKTEAEVPSSKADNPFGDSTKAMFADFEKVKNNSGNPAGTGAPSEENTEQFEKNFMGMF